MPIWTPENQWEGLDVFVVGGGVSLQSFNWDLLKDEWTIGCNDAFLEGKDLIKLCFFGDDKWFKVHKKELALYAQSGGVVFTSCPQLQRTNLKWIWTLVRKSRGFHVDALGWNMNTGASAINLALLLGARRIFLLGFDMHLTEGRSNYHENNLDKPNAGVHKQHLKAMRILDKHLENKFPGREVINVTNDSSLNIFPKVNLDLFFKERKG